jgi:hypothetical protein
MIRAIHSGFAEVAQIVIAGPFEVLIEYRPARETSVEILHEDEEKAKEPIEVLKNGPVLSVTQTRWASLCGAADAEASADVEPTFVRIVTSAREIELLGVKDCAVQHHPQIEVLALSDSRARVSECGLEEVTLSGSSFAGDICADNLKLRMKSGAVNLSGRIVKAELLIDGGESRLSGIISSMSGLVRGNATLFLPESCRGAAECLTVAPEATLTYARD